MLSYSPPCLQECEGLVGSSKSKALTPKRSDDAQAQKSRLDTSSITDPTTRGVADKYFGFGETIFDVLQATAVNSNYFKKGQ